MRTNDCSNMKKFLGRSLLALAVSSSVLLLSQTVQAAPQEVPAPEVPAPEAPASEPPAPEPPAPETPANEPPANETSPASTVSSPEKETSTASDSGTTATAETDSSQETQPANQEKPSPAPGAEVEGTDDLGMLESTEETKDSATPADQESEPSQKDTDSTSPAKELNVPPKDMVPLYEKDRPEWLFKSPTIEDGKLVIYVGGELCSTEEECEKKQPAAMYAEVCNYFDNDVFHERHASLGTPLTSELIANRWVDKKENYVAKVQTSEGTMYQLWSIVRIDDEGIKTMKQWHLATVQPARVRTLGIGLIGLLSSIGLVHLGARFAGRKSRKKA